MTEENESLPKASLKTRVAVIVAVLSTIIVLAAIIGLSIAGFNGTLGTITKPTEPGSYGGNPDGDTPTPKLAESVCESTGHRWEEDSSTPEPNDPNDKDETEFLSLIDSSYICHSGDLKEDDPDYLFYRIVFLKKNYSDIKYLNTIVAVLLPEDEPSKFEILELTQEHIKLYTHPDSLYYFVAFFKNASIEQLFAPSIEKGNEILAKLGFPDRNYYPQNNS